MTTIYNNFEFEFTQLSNLKNGQLFFHNTIAYRVNDMEMESCSCRRATEVKSGWTSVFPLGMKVSAVVNE